MFALPGILLLLMVDYLKPQEYFTELSRLPLLYLFTLLAAAGFVVDVRLGLSRLRAAPQLVWVLGFYLWGLLTTAVSAPQTIVTAFMFLIQVCLFLLVGHAVQSFRSLQITVGTLLGIGLLLAFIGVHQGMAPKGCFQVVLANREVIPRYDGRECENRAACREEGAEPGAAYECEHIGLLGTSSVQGRVRYRGTLADPNELALGLGIALPFAFAFFDRRRSAGRGLLLVTTCVLVGLCAILTQSRGGQLVFLAVLGVYFVRRMGIRGVALAAVLVLPIVLFGGRSGSETEASTEGRLLAWAEGWELFRSSPVFGIGFKQFAEHHWIAAHSSYVLAYAEQGLPGFFLFSVILYLSLKIPIAAIRSHALAPIALTWSVSILAATIGTLVGIAFLSFTYKEQLWIYIGLSAALYHCIKLHVPDFTVRISWLEAGLIAAGDVALMLLIHAYTIYKGV